MDGRMMSLLARTAVRLILPRGELWRSMRHGRRERKRCGGEAWISLGRGCFSLPARIGDGARRVSLLLAV